MGLNQTESWLISANSSENNSGSEKAGDELGSGGYGTPALSVQVILSIVYLTIIIVTVGGNGIVCYTVIFTKRMRTLTNTFIVNLAVSDILIATISMPFTFLTENVFSFWPFGEFMCRIVNYVMSTSIFVSSYTLITIAADRYFAIIYPLRPRMTKIHAIMAIAGIWIFSGALALPLALFTSVEHDDEAGGKMCWENKWPSGDHQAAYDVALICLHYFVPVTILAFAYFRISYVIWVKKIPGEAENTRDQRMAQSKLKMIKMMITVVVFYGICWLPFYVFMTLLKIDEKIPNAENTHYLKAIYLSFHILALSNSCVNPIIYCWMSSKFRQGFKYVFRWCPCVEYEAEPTTRSYMIARANTCSTSTGVSMRSKLSRPSDSNCGRRGMGHGQEVVPLTMAGPDNGHDLSGDMNNHRHGGQRAYNNYMF